MEAGLNLYSLRTSIRTEEDFLLTARRLKEAGYSFLQFSGAAFDAEEIRRVTEQAGIPVTLTHVPFERIVHDTDALMKEHALFGCRQIGLGSLPVPVTNEEGVRAAIAELAGAAKRMADAGFTLFYHNHFGEFRRYGDKTVFDLLIEEAPELHFTVDTYWLQYGGADIYLFAEKLKGRMECVHLKDYKITDELRPGFAPVGDGVTDYRRLIPRLREMGAREFYVEQDNAATLPDGFENVCRSIRYIRENL